MTQPPEFSPEEAPGSARARRRRASRQLIQQLTPDERAGYLEDVARRASPSIDFFIFSLLAGAVIGFGFLTDSPYLLLVGALLAPLMSPVVGISLGTVLGSSKLFGRGLGGLSVGSLLVVLVGALAGFAARLGEPQTLLQVQAHAQLSWSAFLVVGLGAALTSATLVREKSSPAIPSAALAYGLYLPLCAAGFGLGSGLTRVWWAGLVLFLIHLAWATLLGAGVLWYMGFRPYTLFGYSLGGVIALIGIILALGFSGAGAVLGAQVGLPTATFTPSPTLPPSVTPSETPEPPTQTLTPSLTPSPSDTPTQTPTPSPTPVLALVNSELGAVLRDAPNGQIIALLSNGALLQLLPETQIDQFGAVWVKAIYLEENIVGWIQQSLIVTATPIGGPPTATPTRTPTPSRTPTRTPGPSPTSSFTPFNLPTATATP